MKRINSKNGIVTIYLQSVNDELDFSATVDHPGKKGQGFQFMLDMGTALTLATEIQNLYLESHGAIPMLVKKESK